MSSYPKIDQLFNAIIEDCYNYLLANSTNPVKESIESLKETIKDKAEIIKKAYVVFCSIGNEKPKKEGKLPSIYDFTIKFIEAVYYHICDTNKNSCINSTISDFCNCYIALSGYAYIFNGCFTNDFLSFDTKNFKCFEKILMNNNVLKDALNYYKDVVNKLYKKGSTIFNNEFFNKFTASFEKTFEYPEIKENKISESPQKSNIEQKKDNISDNGNKLNQLDTCDTSNIQIDNKSIENSEQTSKNKLNEDLFKFILKQYFRLSVRMIDRDYEQMKYLENFFLKLEFYSIEINCVNKKSEYFENIINSFKNTIFNLGNSYNYNLWLKLSNIILKNLLMILSKKNINFFNLKTLLCYQI